MNRRRMVAVAAAVATTLAGCAGVYRAVPRATVLTYQTRPTYGHLYDVADAYAQATNYAIEHDTLHPGQLADFGVALALMGHDGEACRMLNAEAFAFPQSAPLVARLKQKLVPSLVDDTTVARPIYADTWKLAAWAYDSLTAQMPLPHIASVIDSTDTVRLAEQMPQDSVDIPIRLTANQKREALAEEQAAAARWSQHVADSIANAKVAKQTERKLKEKQRKQEAREKVRQRERDKKQRDKEKKRKREEARKEKAKGGKR